MTRLLLALLGAFALTAFASSRAADPPSLKGTWVRESMAGPTSGHQVIITLTDHRVSARFRSGGRDDARKEVWMTVEFEGEYARTDSGLLVGSIIGMNVDLSQAPDMNSLGEPFGKSLTKIIGEPFSFRARVVDGALTVTDLKMPNVMIDDEQGSREMIAAFASGKYVSSPTEDVPLPKLKVAKAIPFNRTRLAGNLTMFMWLMNRPQTLFSSDSEPASPANVIPPSEYYPPEPGQQPRVLPPTPPLPIPMGKPVPITMAPQPMPMPWAMPAPVMFSSQPMPMPMPMPMPFPMPSAMPAPVALSPQPMPTVMPASMATMAPQPLPQYLPAEVVPGNFFYFRPCRVEETFAMADRTMLLSQIVLPVTPAFVPESMGMYDFGRHNNNDSNVVFNSKILVSSPCWLGTEVTPMAQAMQIPTVNLPVQAMFVPQPRKEVSVWSPKELLFGSDLSTPKTATQVPTPPKSSHELSDYYVPSQSPSPALVGPNASERAEALMHQSETSGPGASSLTPMPADVDRIHGGIMDESNPSRETVIREIDLGEAGTMQVIVRMKRDNAKPMLPLPTPVSQLPMQPPVPSTLIPAAGQMLPPGSMRNVPVMPAIADAWKNATRIEGGIMK